MYKGKHYKRVKTGEIFACICEGDRAVFLATTEKNRKFKQWVDKIILEVDYHVARKPKQESF